MTSGLSTLQRIADELGIALDALALDRLARYRDLLLDWNQRVNLTAIRDPDAVEIRLFADSIALLPLIRRLAGTHPGTTTRLIDVGSGAGFPGLALAIADPTLSVTLAEATRKKVDFMRHVVDELGIPNATPIHGRAEELARETAHRARYTIATARAVASLPALIEICLPLIATGGHALFPKGQNIEDEMGAARVALRELRGRLVEQARLTIPELSATTIVVVGKTGTTPTRYPRPAGQPARQPLGSGPQR